MKNKNLKKVLSLMLIGTVAAGMLGACSKAADNKGSETGKAKPRRQAIRFLTANRKHG